MSIRDELLRRAGEYTRRRGLLLADELGFGLHGIVFATESQPTQGQPAIRSAIKVYQREADHRRERDVYLRLKEHGVKAVRGCRVPRLIGHDDQLWVIEMTVVKRPFVLDFAGAYLDQSPDFSDEVLADWEIDKEEQFGARWSEVRAILRELEGLGVYMLDVNPGNIAFDD